MIRTLTGICASSSLGMGGPYRIDFTHDGNIDHVENPKQNTRQDTRHEELSGGHGPLSAIITSMMLGGIRIPRLPPAATIPIVNSLEYPYLMSIVLQGAPW